MLPSMSHIVPLPPPPEPDAFADAWRVLGLGPDKPKDEEPEDQDEPDRAKPKRVREGVLSSALGLQEGRRVAHRSTRTVAMGKASCCLHVPRS